MANQELSINRKKLNLRKHKRLVKRAVKLQTNNKVAQPEAPVNEKKARREAKKAEIKRLKKAAKAEKREHRMDIESEGEE